MTTSDLLDARALLITILDTDNHYSARVRLAALRAYTDVTDELDWRYRTTALETTNPKE